MMALDIGEVRCGIAVSDPDARVASPLVVLPADEVASCAKSFRLLLEDWEPELLVCGLPMSFDGTDGPQAKRMRQVAGCVSDKTGLPVEFADERLSSSEAKRRLREMGYDERKMRGKVDMIAASLFLQAYLDSHADLGARSVGGAKGAGSGATPEEAPFEESTSKADPREHFEE